MNILVVGQSHVAAIRAAARIRREADPARPRTRVIHTLEPRYAPELTDNDFAAPLADEIAVQIARHRPLVAACIGGNAHNILGLLRHPRPFDFALGDDRPGDPAAAGEGAEPLPLGLVRATLAAAMARDLLRLRLLAAAAGRFVQLESPPPLADAGFIAARADAFFRERGITAAAVAPAPFRRRIWRLHSAIVAEACAALGVRVLPVPAAALTPDGYLRPDLAGDATHGNAAYGELLIRSLERDAA